MYWKHAESSEVKRYRLIFSESIFRLQVLLDFEKACANINSEG